MRYQRLNIGDLPSHVWDRFPSNDTYLKNLMLFCQYTHREAILRLKDGDEVKRMFQSVLELEELIPDEQRRDMFGIFERKPSLLRILPGLQPGFKRWLQEVENLVPKRGMCSKSHPPEKKRKKHNADADAMQMETSNSTGKKDNELTVSDITAKRVSTKTQPD